MKHTGLGARLRPQRDQARAQRRRSSRRAPRTTGRPPAENWPFPWRLDVGDRGELLAVHEDTGTVRVLANIEEE